MYRLHRAARGFVGPHAVQCRSRDDVRVVDPIAVAVEGTVVHDDRLVADEDVGARRGVEKDPDAAPPAFQRVPAERMATPCPGDSGCEAFGGYLFVLNN